MEYLSDDEIAELVRNTKADIWCAVQSEKVNRIFLCGVPLVGQERTTEFAENGRKPIHEPFDKEIVKKHLEESFNGGLLTIVDDNINFYHERLIAIKTQWGWVKFDDFMITEVYR